MKKIALILLLFLGMTLSFVAIGLVILFATGAVTSMDEAQALLSGQLPGGESAFLQSDEALLHGSHEVDFPLVTGRHATIFADSGMPSAVIRLMTLTAIDASVF